MKTGEDLEVRKGHPGRHRRLRMLFAFTMAAVLTFTGIPTTMLYAEPGDPPGSENSGSGEQHTHSWTYRADGSVIYAWCTAEGCPYFGTSESHENALQLRITPASDVIYDGTGHGTDYSRSVDAIPDDPFGTPQIQYTGTTAGGLSYTDTAAPLDAGSYNASVAVSGSSISTSFSISPKTLTGASITVTNPTYTGSPLVPTVSVSLTAGGPELLRDQDYTLDVAEQTNVGNYSLMITGKGNYTGTVSEAWRILPAERAIDPPTGKTDLVYNGTDQELVTAGSIEDGRIQYSLDGEIYADIVPTGKKAGDYTVYYKTVMDENYENTDSGILHVTIRPCPVKISGITAISKVYDGNDAAELSVEQAVIEGRAAGDSLGVAAVGTFDNKNAGEGKAVAVSNLVLTGNAETISNYVLAESGQQTEAEASITPKPLTVSWINTELIYNGREQKPTAAVSGICAGDACEVEVSGGEKNAGNNYTAEATLSNNNYKIAEGTGSTLFSIKPKDLLTAALTLDKETFHCDKTLKEPVLTVKDQDALLVLDKDYVFAENSENSGTECKSYTILISGKGNYEGSAAINWEIIDDTAPTAIIRVEDYETPFTSFLNAITFNIFYKEKKLVTITAEDEGSGISKIEYYLSQTEMTKTALDQAAFMEYKNPFCIEEEKKYIVYAKAEDREGNYTYVSSNGIVMDTTAPSITLTSNAAHEGDDYFGPVAYQISDSYLSEVSISSVGEIKGADTRDLVITGGTSAEGNDSEVGSYIISATDKAGNRTSKSFQIKRAEGTVMTRNAEYTYVKGQPYDVSTLFSIADGTGAAEKYEVVAGGTGYGVVSGQSLTISRAGTIRIRVTTKQLSYVDRTAAEAVLTVQKAQGEAEITAEDALYGDYPEVNPATTTNEGTSQLIWRRVDDAAELKGMPREAGEYTVKVIYPENDLYTEASAETTFQIAKAPLFVTADSMNKVYGNADPELSFRVEGLKWEDTVGEALNGRLARSAGEDTGTYVIGQGSLKPGSNYTLTFTEAEMTISKALHEDVIFSPQIELPSGGVTNRKVELSGYLEKEPVLLSSSVTGDIGDRIIVGGLTGTKLTYSMTENANGSSGTMILVVGSRNYEDYRIRIPLESMKKVTEVKMEGTSGIVSDVKAEGLSAYTDKQSGSSVEVTMTVTPQAEAEVRPPETVEQVNSRVAVIYRDMDQNEIKKEYLDVSVVKNVKYANGTEKNEEVTDTGKVMELEFVCTIDTRFSPVVFREHEGKVMEFTRLTSRPTSGYRDGTYYLSADRLYLYTRYFSTFSIAYTTVESSTVLFEYSSGKTEKSIVANGSRISAPETPRRAGSTFMGWYDSNGLLYNFDMPVTADMKLKAAWKSNGGSAGASNSQMNSSSSAADMGIADPYMPGSGGTALGGVIASIYQKDNAVRSASLSASLNGGISVLASRAPKTGDTLPPFWLFAILCAAGGILTAVYILTALRRKEHENSASR